MNNNNITVKELPDSLKPYERCEQYGAGVLSDAELLAVIIRCGTVNEKSYEVMTRILGANNGAGLFNLHYMSLRELQQYKGIGRVKAIQLKCVAELTVRMARLSRNVREDFHSPGLIAAYYMENMRNLDRENVLVIMLDGKSRRISDTIVSTGSVNSAFASVREVYCLALKAGAVRIVLLHNHPSGDPTPSKADLYITERIKEAGELIGIPLVDHIIIGDNCYYSVKESGYL